MAHEEFDDGLVHGHDWANEMVDRSGMPMVEDAGSVPTPSSVFNDDAHHDGAHHGDTHGA